MAICFLLIHQHLTSSALASSRASRTFRRLPNWPMRPEGGRISGSRAEPSREIFAELSRRPGAEHGGRISQVMMICRRCPQKPPPAEKIDGPLARDPTRADRHTCCCCCCCWSGSGGAVAGGWSPSGLVSSARPGPWAGDGGRGGGIKKLPLIERPSRRRKGREGR